MRVAATIRSMNSGLNGWAGVLGLLIVASVVLPALGYLFVVTLKLMVRDEYQP